MIEFNEFEKVSTSQWKLKIQADLKGKDYQTLITKTPEGIDIKPFYHYDDYRSFASLTNTSFSTLQELNLADERVANKIINKALLQGADKLIINASKKFDIEAVTARLDYSRLIFKLDFLDPDFFIKLYHKTKGKSRIVIDPIGHLIRTGNWYYNQNTDFDLLKEIQREIPPDFRFLEVDSAHFHNSGATSVQQIAYSLAQAVEYIERLGVQTVSQLSFYTSIGPHYFFEIVKVKSLRYLWNLILTPYNKTAETFITAIPGLRNKTLLNPYINMLRTTMENMSAILGGADEIVSMPYDKIFNKTNSYSERLARNQLIILKEEAGFDKASEAFDDSYFLEQIAHELSEKSLNLFKSIEKSGGIIQQLMKGKIQEKVTAAATKEQEQFDRGEKVLVGVNKYINDKEEIISPTIFPFMKRRKGKTLIPPVIARRLSEDIEKKILKEKGIEL
jgi:methylmalonyl-CoA mutase